MTQRTTKQASAGASAREVIQKAAEALLLTGCDPNVAPGVRMNAWREVLERSEGLRRKGAGRELILDRLSKLAKEDPATFASLLGEVLSATD